MGSSDPGASQYVTHSPPSPPRIGRHRGTDHRRKPRRRQARARASLNNGAAGGGTRLDFWTAITEACVLALSISRVTVSHSVPRSRSIAAVSVGVVNRMTNPSSKPFPEAYVGVSNRAMVHHLRTRSAISATPGPDPMVGEGEVVDVAVTDPGTEEGITRPVRPAPQAHRALLHPRVRIPPLVAFQTGTT